MDNTEVSKYSDNHPNRVGWPWTEASLPLPPTMPDGTPWPKISVVTPSFNQAQFLEETIRSVLLQGYTNLEYIIIDGGSTDGSVEIIKKYDPWLAYWVSEPDRGQSHAINKGFDHSTGEILAWINSDDYYAAGAFNKVAEIFSQNETKWVAGKTNVIQGDGRIAEGEERPKELLRNWYFSTLYLQPGVFWKRELWEKSGGIDESLHFSFDYELWLKFAKIQPFAYWTEKCLAYFRKQPQSKTSQNQLAFMQEDKKIFKRYPYHGRSIKDQYFIWKQRRERIFSTYFFNDNFDRPLKHVMTMFLIAPWNFFYRKYLSEILRILFPKFLSRLIRKIS